MNHQIRNEIRSLDLQNDTENDEIMKNIRLLIQGDFSNIAFFDHFFNLPAGRSFSTVSSLEHIFLFLLQSFCQNECSELTYNSLLIINRLISCHIDVSFLFNDEFITQSIALFRHPNKILASYSLNTLTLFIHLSDEYLERCLSLNLIQEIENVAIFPNEIIVDNEVQYQCYKSVAKSIIYLSHINSLTKNETYSQIFLHISHRMLFSDIPVLNKYGLEILKCMIDSSDRGSLPFEINEEVGMQFLNFADTAPDFVLNNMFELIMNYDYSKLEDFLIGNGFFIKLIQRIEDDSRYTMMIFRFLDAVEYHPEADDPIIPKLIGIIANGTRENRTAGLKYIHTLMISMPPEFCVFLVCNGIIAALCVELDEKIEITNEILVMISKLVNCLIANGIDLAEVEQLPDLQESLHKLLDDYSCGPSNFEISHNIEFIESILSKFPEE